MWYVLWEHTTDNNWRKFDSEPDARAFGEDILDYPEVVSVQYLEGPR